MRTWLLFVSGFFFACVSLVACGPITPQAACERGLQANCTYIHRCATAEQKQSSHFEKLFGADVAACVRIRQEGATSTQGGVTLSIEPAKCSEKTEQTYCKDAKTPIYHPEFVAQCHSDFETQACPPNLLLPPTPASCEKVCQAT
ncbi:hypothetical protein L6R29_03100 [Myxococcota bacterium]|nr:hypothetical protein [Myxococcota bacterium]